MQITSASTEQLFWAERRHMRGQQASQASKVKLQVSCAAEGHKSGQADYAARWQMHFVPLESIVATRQVLRKISQIDFVCRVSFAANHKYGCELVGGHQLNQSHRAERWLVS